MREKYQNTYRTQTARALWHNYDGGVYFITICTLNHVHYFGEIINHEMRLSTLGKYAQTCWEAIPFHFPHVETPLFVIMPNHIHGILIIKNPHTKKKESPSHNSHNEFGPQSLNLASVMRGFKAGVTKFAKMNGIIFAWQPRFYDRIIRNLEEWSLIATYIENNVGRWDMDKYNEKSEKENIDNP